MIDYSIFKHFKPSQPTGERMSLPAGIYEAHVIQAKVEERDDMKALLIYVEIDKGEYAGFYRKQYDSQQGSQFNVRYKGIYRIQLPDGQSEEHDNWRQHQLEAFVWAMEDGNPGYKWNWDEDKLKGLKCGLNVRERDYYVNQKLGTTTEIGRIESIAKVNDPDETKRPKPMRKRELSNSAKARMAQDAQKSNDGFVVVEDEQLPF